MAFNEPTGRRQPRAESPQDARYGAFKGDANKC